MVMNGFPSGLQPPSTDPTPPNTVSNSTKGGTRIDPIEGSIALATAALKQFMATQMFSHPHPTPSPSPPPIMITSPNQTEQPSRLRQPNAAPSGSTADVRASPSLDFLAGAAAALDPPGAPSPYVGAGVAPTNDTQVYNPGGYLKASVRLVTLVLSQFYQ
jgi:hypothetical protein